MQILEQRVTLEKVRFCTRDWFHRFDTFNGNIVCESKVYPSQEALDVARRSSPEAQRHLSNKTEVTTTFVIEGWTLENVAKFTKVLGLEKCDLNSNRYVKHSFISLNTCHNLWWMYPEDTPEGAEDWICHFLKLTTREFMRLLDKGKVREVQKLVEVRKAVARALPESSEESDSEKSEMIMTKTTVP